MGAEICDVGHWQRVNHYVMKKRGKYLTYVKWCYNKRKMALNYMRECKLNQFKFLTLVGVLIWKKNLETCRLIGACTTGLQLIKHN